MAAGDRFFGYQPDPNFTNPLANFTDTTRQGSAGSSNGDFRPLNGTDDMPDGLYKYKMDFQIFNTGGSGNYYRLDSGTESRNIGYTWTSNLVIGQLTSKEGIIKVDKGVGNTIGIDYPNGWYGMIITFQYIGALI